MLTHACDNRPACLACVHASGTYFYQNIIFLTQGNVTRDSFLPFGPAHGDLTAPRVDDGTSQAIQLTTDIVIFGSRRNRLYVSSLHNRVNNNLL